MALNMFNSTMPRLVTPTPAVDTSPQQLWGQVSNTLQHFADQQMKDWQEATIKEAGKQGALEGQKENPEFRPGNSLAAEAFNTLATKNYMANLEVKTAGAMAALTEKNKFNPSNYQAESQAYINKLTETVSQNPATAEYAGMIKAKLTLQSQSDGYKISKNYMEQQAEETKAANEDLFNVARENAYMVAGGVFSKDPAVQQAALGTYSINKKMMETALHAVMPDGTPLYSPMAIQKRLQAYHEEFFLKGTQAYLADNTSLADTKDVINGTFAITLPTGEKIDILREVGIKNYESGVRDFLHAKNREKIAESNRRNAANESYSKEVQKANGLELMAGLLSGESKVSSEVIIDNFKRGKLSSSDAMAALKLAQDPRAGLADSERVADLEMKIYDGQDIQSEIKLLAKSGEITPKTMQKLLEENAKSQKGIIDDNKRFIKSLVVEKDSFGIDDPKTLRHARDMMDQYDHMVKVENMTPELALEKVRNNIDVIKDRKNTRKYNSVPLYMKVGADNEIDVGATYDATKEKHAAGLLSDEEFNIEVERLKAIKNERKTK